MVLMCKSLSTISITHVTIEPNLTLLRQMEPLWRPHRPVRRFGRQQQLRFRPRWNVHLQRGQVVQGYFQG